MRHQPQRPGWTCCRCGLPYPCPVGQIELLAAFGPATLGRHAYRLLEQAAQDQPNLRPKELWTRFVAWTKPELPEPVGRLL